MVQGIPYVHWKIKDAVNVAEIDPVYLWGTVIESNKGPIDTPVFCTDAEQVKQIFNYDLRPFFVNGGRSVVIVRAYAGQPQKASFSFTLSEPFKYVYADYDYYDADDATSIKATVYVEDPNAEKPKPIKNTKIYAFTSYNNADKTTEYGQGTVKTLATVTAGEKTFVEVQVIENAPEASFVGNKYFVIADATADGVATTELLSEADTTKGVGIFVSMKESSAQLNVRFDAGRWRECTEDGQIKYYYAENDELKEAVILEDELGVEAYYIEGTTEASEDKKIPIDTQIITKSFNESDVSKVQIARVAEILEGSEVLDLTTVYPGDFLIPVSVQKDIRAGYRVSLKESDDYTILLSGVTTLTNIAKRINERANNVVATITQDGEKIEKVFTSSLISVKNSKGEYILPNINEADALDAYTEYVQQKAIPVGSIFAKVPQSNQDSEEFSFALEETVTYLADGSNGVWDSELNRIANPANLQNRQLIANAHREALDHLANVKVSGIFCNYGEDEVQKVYTEHVSTTEPEGMNSAEVCKWRTLILGANAFDRTNDSSDTVGFKLVDKATSLDNENILFLGQGLIDDGYTPEANIMKSTDKVAQNQYVSLLHDDSASLPNQLLPFQCTQYIAGLRSKLFYGDSIFGGQAKKEIVGVGNLSIAPLFAGENKILWQPDNYVYLNEHGVLTFTTDYNQLTLLDGVTTKQSPLEEDEEGVQSIIKYAKHAVHESLQTYIGRNLTNDLQILMQNSVENILNVMQTQDQTLIAVESEGLRAYEIDIALVPRSNASQVVAKAYVYLKLTPVHALRQIEVELTVQ